MLKRWGTAFPVGETGIMILKVLMLKGESENLWSVDILYSRSIYFKEDLLIYLFIFAEGSLPSLCNKRHSCECVSDHFHSQGPIFEDESPGSLGRCHLCNHCFQAFPSDVTEPNSCKLIIKEFWHLCTSITGSSFLVYTDSNTQPLHSCLWALPI